MEVSHRRREAGHVSQLRRGGGTYHFCPVCGSTVYYTADADEARIGVKVGTFTDPTFPPPKISGFEEYRHPWAMNAADLPMQHLD